METVIPSDVTSPITSNVTVTSPLTSNVTLTSPVNPTTPGAVLTSPINPPTTGGTSPVSPTTSGTTASGSGKTPPKIMANNSIDRKVLRETLYSEIFQKHRRSIFALGSFLRMLKTKKSNYDVIKQDGDSE